jgi:hypothetical protein
MVYAFFSGYSSQQAGLAAALLIFRLGTCIEANFETSSIGIMN